MTKFISLLDGRILNIDSISYIEYSAYAFDNWHGTGLEPAILTIYINNNSMPYISFGNKDRKAIDYIFKQIEQIIGYDNTKEKPTDMALFYICKMHRDYVEKHLDFKEA